MYCHANLAPISVISLNAITIPVWRFFNALARFVDSAFISRYHRGRMNLLDRLPLAALVVALLVFTLLLFLLITSGVGLAQPVNAVFLLALVAGILFLFLAQNPNNENAALLLWYNAGAWGAAAFLNFQMLGLPALVVAALAAGGAFWIERASRAFSFIGPALFIGVALSLVILARMLTM